jgi:hypothetical protein
LNFGGHLFTIVKLNSKIKEYLGVDLPITALFAAPSIEQLANVIRAGGWSPPRNCLIEIRPAGSKPPLFVMGTGHALSPYLDFDRPLYGLSLLGMFEKQVTLTTLKEIAASFIDSILSVQPKGPVLFGRTFVGWYCRPRSGSDARRSGWENCVAGLAWHHTDHGLEVCLFFKSFSHIGGHLNDKSLKMGWFRLTYAKCAALAWTDFNKFFGQFFVFLFYSVGQSRWQKKYPLLMISLSQTMSLKVTGAARFCYAQARVPQVCTTMLSADGLECLPAVWKFTKSPAIT